PPPPVATFPGVYTDSAKSSPANHPATPAPPSPASRYRAAVGQSSTTSPPSCCRYACSREGSPVAEAGPKLHAVTSAGKFPAHPPSGHRSREGFLRLPWLWQRNSQLQIHPPDYSWSREESPVIRRRFPEDSFPCSDFECQDQKVCGISQDWLPHSGHASRSRLARSRMRNRCP